MVHTQTSSRVTEACSHHACPRREVCTLTRALQRCLTRRIPSLEEKLDSFARRALELLLGRVVELVVSQAASARVDARTRQTLASERNACGARRVGLMGGGYAARLCREWTWLHPEGLERRARRHPERRKSEHRCIQKGVVARKCEAC